MRKALPLYALIIAVIFVAGCGFEPLHGQSARTDSQSLYNDIFIDNIPGRSGQILRNELIDRFYTQGRPSDAAYILKIEGIEETQTNLDITVTADTTRNQLRLDTKMRLEDRSTGELLLERNLMSITSYNVLQSQFTTRVSEDNARENVLKDLARQIDTQIALYLKRR